MSEQENRNTLKRFFQPSARSVSHPRQHLRPCGQFPAHFSWTCTIETPSGSRTAGSGPTEPMTHLICTLPSVIRARKRNRNLFVGHDRDG